MFSLRSARWFTLASLLCGLLLFVNLPSVNAQPASVGGIDVFGACDSVLNGVVGWQVVENDPTSWVCVKEIRYETATGSRTAQLQVNLDPDFFTLACWLQYPGVATVARFANPKDAYSGQCLRSNVAIDPSNRFNVTHISKDHLTGPIQKDERSLGGLSVMAFCEAVFGSVSGSVGWAVQNERDPHSWQCSRFGPYPTPNGLKLANVEFAFRLTANHFASACAMQYPKESRRTFVRFTNPTDAYSGQCVVKIPPPPLPTPTSAPPSTPVPARPTVQYDVANSVITGSGFLPNTTVYIRVVIISNNPISGQYNGQTLSLNDGRIRLVQPIFCYRGDMVGISANDGRRAPNSSEPLWSTPYEYRC